jgi:hypothetical protein
MRKMYGQAQSIAEKKGTPTRDVNGGTRAPSANSSPLKVAPLTEAQLQRLIATHLGESVEKPGTAVYVLGIAEHVLPAGWTPVQ